MRSSREARYRKSPDSRSAFSRFSPLARIGLRYLHRWVACWCITRVSARIDRGIDRMRMFLRAHQPKASYAVVSDHDQIPVARFSPPARAGGTSRKPHICRSDHRNASICSTSVRAERSADVSVKKWVRIGTRLRRKSAMRYGCGFRAESAVGKFGFMVRLSRLSPVARTGLRHCPRLLRRRGACSFNLLTLTSSWQEILQSMTSLYPSSSSLECTLFSTAFAKKADGYPLV